MKKYEYENYIPDNEKKIEKKKKIKLSNKIIALLTSIVLGVSGYVIIKENNKNNNKDMKKETIPTYKPTITIQPTNTPIKETHISIENSNIKTEKSNVINRGDCIRTTSELNMRLDTSTNSFKTGTINKDSIVGRILSINGFDLVRYYDKLSFVSSDYTDSNVIDYNNEYYSVEEYNDIIHTTTEVNFRLGPSKNEDKIQLLNKNEELAVFAKTTSYNDPNDIWYIAKYKDKIGFINAQYTKSLKEEIKKIDPDISNIEIKKIGYANNNTFLYDYQGNNIKDIEEYQTFKIFDEKDYYYLVEYDNKIGLVPKNDVRSCDGNFVVVDLSDQKIFMYCNTDLVFESFCTTGADDTPTYTGAFSVYERTNSRYFSDEREARYMWANFDHGNGLHDAPWESKEKFGNNNYRKKHGSKGCIRLPDEAAIFLKEYVKEGTKVLVKK